MRVQQFEPGQSIVREGEPGTRFYIVNEGEVKCVKKGEAGQADEELLRLKDQDYFGERALLTEEPRAASVVAVTSVECLVLERADFAALLGDLGHILAQEAKRREDRAAGIGGGSSRKAGAATAGATAAGGQAVVMAVPQQVQLPCPKLKMEELNIVREPPSGGG